MTARSISAPMVIETKEDKRPKRPTLQTPVSACYPSEVKSPYPGTPSYIKREDNIKTPVTPPAAYLDFLKSVASGLASPLTTGTSSKFHFNNNDKVACESIEEGEEGNGKEKATDVTASTSVPSPPPPQQTLSRTNSTSSESSISTFSSESTRSASIITSNNNNKTTSNPQSPRVMTPPSPFARPRSAKLPRGIHIPPTPLTSPANLRSPMSGGLSASASSATPWSTSHSPSTAEAAESSGKFGGKMSVRQVVTRTVTYSRTALDPAPKGKKRKTEE